MKSSIRALAELVLEYIDALEADCARRGAEVPSLLDPYTPGSEFTLEDANVQRASTVIVAAAQQLIQTVQNPQVNLLMTAYSVCSEFICLTPGFTFSSVDHACGRDSRSDRVPHSGHTQRSRSSCWCQSNGTLTILTYIFRVFTSKGSARDAKRTMSKLVSSDISYFPFVL